MPWYAILLITIAAIVVLLVLIIRIVRKNKKKAWIKQQRDEVMERAESYYQRKQCFTANEFLDFYNKTKQQNIKISSIDGPGIYIFSIGTRPIYIGQSINVFKRVNSHLIGGGNGDIYHEYKSGANLRIQIIKCHHDKLNELESYYIEKCKTCLYGYNRNKGIHSIW